ncbi:mediator of RNA polymerase ii transcription subunit 4 [Plakobranchus ocellatus]|uniref:Mediator of RNA polymerase II transcription subunit 4 n=1 Tax=Plakobranchus ocellatus TaxID=259542 RepID=A0AAV4AQD1_9GAST|nr:mediator of RNA polymerase ii transcription subunit 4 [Plakobranchus ocellatus]
MATEASTRQKLHSVIDDMELISKELIEQLAMPKSQRRPDAPDTEEMMQLLIEKDTELKEILKIAEEQEKVQKVMDSLRAEVNKRDTEVRQLQRALKEAETIMATAVYQAKQKLAAVRQAQANKVSCEELIKYAHRISASNAVAAPPTWGPGDPRRPYPTDLEMRHSFLSMGSVPESSASTSGPGGGGSRLYTQAQPSHPHHQPHPTTPSGQHHHSQIPSSSSHPHHPHHHQQHLQQQLPHHLSSGQANHPPLSWQSSQESLGGGSLGSSHHDILSKGGNHGNKDEDDVELMSSDSSSSSSSDE